MTTTLHVPAVPTFPERADVITDDQFRGFAAGLSQIVWRVAADGSRFIGPRWAEITGVHEHRLRDDGWLTTIHAADRLGASAAHRAATMHRAMFRADFRLRHRDGTYHWYRARSEPIRDSFGHVVARVGIATNIDEQKAAEALLVENEARLRLVIEAARVGTIDHDLRTGEIDASPLARAHVGVPLGDGLTFARVVERVHPDDVRAFEAANRRGADPAGDGRIEISFRGKQADGSFRQLAVRGTVLFDGDGGERQPARFVGVVSDVDDHVRELEDRARLAAIITSSDDAIIATTTDGVVTHWNAAAQRTFGYAPAEATHQSILRIVPPDLIDDERASLEHVARGASIAGSITERLTRNGRRIVVSRTMSPIRDAAGACIGISSIVRDVTAQRTMEDELRQAQKMEAVAQLAGGVAHDLNNMLTAVLVGVEIAQLSPSMDDATRGNLRDVHDSCFQASELIRQLLVVAKRQVITPRHCSVNDVIREILPILARVAGEGVALEPNLFATTPVFADPAQLQQVVLNLALNARDAMPHGGSLTITTSDDLEASGVRIRVADTGTGMTPEVKARLFEPFFTTKAPGFGTGLGLSTAYGIVAQSGGTISVQSELGHGSAFTIALPKSDGEVVPFRSRPRVEEPSPPIDGTGSGTVLLVEDDRTVRDQIARALSELGYEVIEARNGVDALTVLESYAAPVDLVLSDIVMPEMSGTELAGRLREWYPRLRVLFMSGYSANAIAANGLTDGEQLLEKPFELAELARRVRDVLDHAAKLPSFTVAAR